MAALAERCHPPFTPKNTLPLIVTHGWPGSVIELLKIIDPLTNPTAHGASASDAFAGDPSAT